MAFTAGLASGLQAGARIGFGIQDRKRRAALDQQARDRQALLDQRYADNQATQEAHYQDTLAYRNQVHGDEVKAAEAAREDRRLQREATAKYRAGTLGIQAKLLGMKQQAAKDQKVRATIAGYMREAILNGAANEGEVASQLIRKKGALNALMDAQGVQNIHFAPYQASDGTTRYAVLGERKGDTTGEQVLIGMNGEMQNPDESYQGLSRPGLAAILADHFKTDPSNVYAAAGDVQKEMGKMTEAEKIKLKNQGALDVANAKAAAKGVKPVKVTKLNRQDAAKFLSGLPTTEVPHGWENTINEDSPITQDFAAKVAQYKRDHPNAAPTEANSAAWADIKRSVVANNDYGLSKGDEYHPGQTASAPQQATTPASYAHLWGGK